MDKKRFLRFVAASIGNRPLPFHAVFLLAIFLMLGSAVAGSATWKLDPTNNDWNTATNWTPETVPNQYTDVATFGVSNVTDVSSTTNMLLAGIAFDSGASAYTIHLWAVLVGRGVINNSGITQYLEPTSEVGAPVLGFSGRATAGNNVVYTAIATPYGGFIMNFGDHSDAGTATIIVEGGHPRSFIGKSDVW